MQFSETSVCKTSESESENVLRFNKSLQELRDLRLQLHHAAEYCEATFLNAKEKKVVVENTKEYICRAVVAVVDHLGCVSSNLNQSISKNNEFSEAELRINSLNQRLLSCEEYAHKLALKRVRWSANLPRFHRRYLSAPITNVEIDKLNEDERNPNSSAAKIIIDKPGLEAEDLPLFLCTYTQKPSLGRNSYSIEKDDSDSASALPVHDGLSILSKAPNPTFHFQQISQKHGRYRLFRKSASRNSSNEIFSLIRRIKRTI